MDKKIISLPRVIKVIVDLLRKKGKYNDPEAYDWVVDKYLGRSKLAQDLGKLLEKLIVKKGVILDLAAGTGVLSLELAKRGYHVYAADISYNMINKLQTEAKRQSLKIFSLQLDLNTKLPFENNSFSAVVTSSANRYIRDVDHFLSEIYRILQKNGYFIWPILITDIIPWKINYGLKQPTLSFSLVNKMKKHGFIVEKDTVKSILRNTLNSVPVYAIPTYLIGKKSCSISRF
jgi:ubiquinone/menaquinone biosynthesis C-methylase UbiE